MRKLLALSPEAILPPQSGGSLRTASLLVGLAKYLNVYVLLPQNQEAINEALDKHYELHGPHWLGVKGHIAYQNRSLIEKARNRYWRWREHRLRLNWRHLPWDWFFGEHHSWKPVIKALSEYYTPDFFLVEHTRNASICSYAKKVWPSVICVVDSHNVESNLLRQVLASGAKSRSSIKRAEKHERSIARLADVLWACSDADLEQYKAIDSCPKKTAVIPNGVSTSRVSFDATTVKVPTILFIGNLAYDPNIKGVHWFHRNVWPRLKKDSPLLKWQLVGSSADPSILALECDDIKIAVNVPSVQPYLDQAIVSICPIFSGSGTRLKILEAFSAGVPVVATLQGAEGIQSMHGKHLLIANSPIEFIDAINQLLVSFDLRDSLRSQARDLVETKYDWRLISEQAAEHLASILPFDLIKTAR
jgi:polysaccharide biosynthesis protein PslH